MWFYAFAAGGHLYTWVNGKMSFETFLGRSRSPHCQSYMYIHTHDSARGAREKSRSHRTFLLDVAQVGIIIAYTLYPPHFYHVF